jgi:hypothetical protein
MKTASIRLARREGDEKQRDISSSLNAFGLRVKIQGTILASLGMELNAILAQRFPNYTGSATRW